MSAPKIESRNKAQIESFAELLDPLTERLIELMEFEEELERDHLQSLSELFIEGKELYCSLCYILTEGVDAEGQSCADPARLAELTNNLLNNLLIAGNAEEALQFIDIAYEHLMKVESKYDSAHNEFLKENKDKYNGDYGEATTAFFKTDIGEEWKIIRGHVSEIESKTREICKLASGNVVDNARLLSHGKAGFSEDPEVGIGASSLGQDLIIVLRSKTAIENTAGKGNFSEVGAKAAYLPTSYGAPEMYDGFLQRFLDQNNITTDDVEVSIVGAKTKLSKGLDDFNNTMRELKGFCDDVDNCLTNMRSAYSGKGSNPHYRAIKDARQAMGPIIAKLKSAEVEGFTGITEQDVAKMRQTILNNTAKLTKAPPEKERQSNSEEIMTTNAKAETELNELFKNSDILYSSFATAEQAEASLGFAPYTLGDMFDFIERHNLKLHSTCIAEDGMPDNVVFSERDDGKGFNIERGTAGRQRKDVPQEVAHIHGLMNLDYGHANVEFASSTAAYSPLFIHESAAPVAYTKVASAPSEVVRRQMAADVPRFEYREMTSIIKGLSELGTMFLRQYNQTINEPLGKKQAQCLAEVKKAAGTGLSKTQGNELTRDDFQALLEQEGITQDGLPHLSFFVTAEGAKNERLVDNLNEPTRQTLSAKGKSGFVQLKLDVETEKKEPTKGGGLDSLISQMDMGNNQGTQSSFVSNLEKGNSPSNSLDSILNGGAPNVKPSTKPASTEGIDVTAMMQAAVENVKGANGNGGKKKNKKGKQNTPPAKDKPVTTKVVTVEISANGEAMEAAQRKVADSATKWSLVPSKETLAQLIADDRALENDEVAKG